MRRAAILGLMALAACSDALEQDTTAGQVIAVAGHTPSITSLVSAANFVVSQAVPITDTPSGSVSGFGSVVIVPTFGGVAVIDLAKSVSTETRVVSLPSGGFGQGSAIQDDAVAWVSYRMPFPPPPPHPYAVWRVNYRSGDTASVGFAANPKAITIAAGNVFIVTVGAGDVSWLTVIDTALTAGSPRISIVDSVPLTGLNAGGITLGGDGYLYVVSGGPLTGGGATEGRLAIVDPVSRLELAVVNGLGDSLGAPVYHVSGRVLIPSVHGILEVNPATRSVTIGPSKGIKPAGDHPTVLALDQRGHIYAMIDNCPRFQQPGVAHVLSPPPAYSLLKSINLDNCPSGAAAATIP